MITLKQAQRHTPTPWSIQKFEEPAHAELVSEIYSPEEEVSICKTTTKIRWGIDGEIFHRNAEFIVRAVNSHDELVALVKEWLRNRPVSSAPSPGSFMDRAQKAISKAEVRS